MSSRPLADRLLLFIPPLMALMLMLFAAVPWHIGFPLAPQVIWLMTLTVGVAYPAAWTPLMAFVLGLIADILGGTPLGSQAVLALLLTLSMRAQSRRLDHQIFRVRWMEAGFALLMINFMLWAVIALMSHEAPPPLPVVRATIVSALWFPFFYGLVDLVAKLLPPQG